MGLGKTLTMISLVLKSIEDYVEKDDEDKENSDDEWQSKNKTRKCKYEKNSLFKH